MVILLKYILVPFINRKEKKMPYPKHFLQDEATVGEKVQFFKEIINHQIKLRLRRDRPLPIKLSDLRFDLTKEIAEILEKEYTEAGYWIDINVHQSLVTLRLD